MLLLFLKTTLVNLLKCYHAYDQAWPHEKDLWLFLGRANGKYRRDSLSGSVSPAYFFGLSVQLSPSSSLTVPADAVEQVTVVSTAGKDILDRNKGLWGFRTCIWETIRHRLRGYAA